MGRNAIESVMGAVVLAVAGLFVSFAYETAQIRGVEGYQVNATFSKIGGLAQGSDVRISGIKVGTVTGQSLDSKTFDAVVTLTIGNSLRLPEDTVAGIESDGLLGGKYVRLEPGRSTSTIPAGGKIRHTRDFRSLEDQVGEIIFLATGGGGNAPGPAGGAPAGAPGPDIKLP